MKTLQVLETAYRATVEEQDDTIVWLTHAMLGAGGQFGLLLTGNAVCYAVPGQRAPALEIGGWKQSRVADPAADVAALAGKGVPVFAVEEDLEERGLRDGPLLEALNIVPRSGVPGLLDDDLEERGLRDGPLLEALNIVPRSGVPGLLDDYPRIWKW